MLSPNANAKMTTTMNGLSPPTVSVSSGPLPQPHTNTAVITPSVAPSDTRFARIALTGTTTDPGNANSSTIMASSVTAAAAGNPSMIKEMGSLGTGAWPGPHV